MELRDMIARYKQITDGELGRPVALADFGLAPAEVESLFGALDEDYHISRYFHFTDQRSSARDAAFSINGFPQTHLLLDKEIEDLL